VDPRQRHLARRDAVRLRNVGQGRADRRPILGDTEAERWARLARLRAALAASGVGEAEGNRRAHRGYGVVGIELLTAAEADELIAALGER